LNTSFNLSALVWPLHLCP